MDDSLRILGGTSHTWSVVDLQPVAKPGTDPAPSVNSHPAPGLLASCAPMPPPHRSPLVATLALAAALAAPVAASAAIGGQPVPVGTHPWAVALERVAPGAEVATKFCGGALIAPRYVLTAAHCAQMEDLDTPADVRSKGLTVRFANMDGQPAIAARRFTVPGSYWWNLWGRRPASDIALVELTSAAPTAPQAVSREVPAPGAAVTDLGYGLTPGNRAMSDVLMQTWTQAAPPAPCGGTAAGGFTVAVSPSTEICTTAGPADTTPPLDGSTCPGDSGSPLLGQDLTAVVGVTSWGRLNACNQPPNLRSAVFAKPGAVAGWLQRQTGAPLFGDPAVPVDHAAPKGATLTAGPLGPGGVPVTVNASTSGAPWRAAVFVMFVRDSATPPIADTVVLHLAPRHRSGVVKPPSGWATQGLDVGDVSARVWRPDNLNGVTLHADLGS